MKTVRIGIVGLGQRGKGMLNVFLAYPYVNVVAICDVYNDRIDEMTKVVLEKRKYEIGRAHV